MADADTGSVECPICGEPFDPTAAGGWCTNPECGEWQYTDDTGTADGTGTEASTAEGDEADSDVEADQNGSGRTEDDTTAPETPEDEAADEEPEDTAEDAAPGAGAGPADASGASVTGEEAEPAGGEEAADEPATPDEGATATDESGAEEGGTDAAEPAADEPETVDCPDCGTELDADANFCVECGTDVQHLPSEPEPLTDCPACGAEVGEADNFCVNCGEDLEVHRGGGAVGDAGDEASTGDSPGEASSAEDAAAEHVAALSEAAEDDPVPDSLVLEVRGRELTVEDGDQVGREVRAALTDAGRPEDEAVRIHREHVRFVREEDAFYLVDLGDNPTRLNGRPLQKGDREPVEPGDELELSGVATLTVRAP